MPSDRRALLSLIAIAIAVPVLADPAGTNPAPVQSRRTAHAFTFETADGKGVALADLAKGPILVVNTATACGFAPQFTGLEQLNKRFGERGLTVLAVPSNDFGQQEPLSGHHIAEAVRQNFGVTFPITAIARVRGVEAHPFYRWAALERPSDTPHWNFHKYLVGRDGALLASFATPVEPLDPRLIRAIGEALDKPA